MDELEIVTRKLERMEKNLKILDADYKDEIINRLISSIYWNGGMTIVNMEAVMDAAITAHRNREQKQ